MWARHAWGFGRLGTRLHPAHARQPVVEVGFGAGMMVMRIPSEMRCNDKGISHPRSHLPVGCFV